MNFELAPPFVSVMIGSNKGLEENHNIDQHCLLFCWKVFHLLHIQYFVTIQSYQILRLISKKLSFSSLLVSKFDSSEFILCDSLACSQLSFS